MTEPSAIPGVAVTTGTHASASGDAGDPHALAAEAESLLVKGQLVEAENAILLALKAKNRPHDYYIAKYFTILARIRSAQNRIQEATGAFRDAVSLTPAIASFHGHFAAFLLRNGELQGAEAEIRTAIRLDPKESYHHATLGAILLEQCFFDDAHTSLRRAIRLNRRSTRAREVLAKLLVAKGDYRGAEKMLARACAIDPNSASLLWALSNIFEEQGNADEVLACTKKILDLDPNNARLHMRISNQCRKAGRLDEAIAAIREACRFDPANQAYRADLASLTKSSVINAGVSGPPNKSVEPGVRSNLSAPRLIERMRIFWRRKKID
jgi:Flp pilus assembly protein TadD